MRNNLVVLSVFMVIACQPQYPQGERLYLAYCTNCHMEDGTGLARLIPPLAGSDQLDNLMHVVCTISYGSEDSIAVNGIWYTEPMPSFSNLTAVELSNLINYINSTWGNEESPTHPAAVEEALIHCQ